MASSVVKILTCVDFPFDVVVVVVVVVLLLLYTTYYLVHLVSFIHHLISLTFTIRPSPSIEVCVTDSSPLSTFSSTTRGTSSMIVLILRFFFSVYILFAQIFLFSVDRIAPLNLFRFLPLLTVTACTSCSYLCLPVAPRQA